MNATIVILLSPVFSFAQGQQIDFLLAGILDTNGIPLISGKVYSYSAGTTSPKYLYTSASLSGTHNNPAILDSYGRLQAWGVGKYKFIVKNSSDETIFTVDNIEYNSVAALASTTTNPFGSYVTFSNANISSLTAKLGSNLDANTFKVINLATGTNPGDAINFAQFSLVGDNILASAAINASMSANAAVATAAINASVTAGLTIASAAINASNAIALTLASATIIASQACKITLPTGVIAMWSGSEASIPSGWNLCDGSNGTPDLRGWFIRSSYGAAVPVGSYTSPYVHNFDVTEDEYPCAMMAGDGGYATQSGSLYPVGTMTKSLAGLSVGTNYIGGYYALAYIMKL